ncbi:MAG: hypothetical protein JRC89_10955 [Deltaproteobacteria bacterium]|nr:hypothetical protein [Deltaproteobacteria bacterium]
MISETQTQCFAWALIPNHAHKKVWLKEDIEGLLKKGFPQANGLIFPTVVY